MFELLEDQRKVIWKVGGEWREKDVIDVKRSEIFKEGVVNSVDISLRG